MPEYKEYWEHSFLAVPTAESIKSHGKESTGDAVAADKKGAVSQTNGITNGESLSNGKGK